VHTAFDAIIVGTGQATLPLAERLAAAGWNIAVIERKLIGGTRINVGYTPIKSLLASAQVAHYNRRAEDFGIVPSIAVMVNMSSVKRRMRSIVDAGQRNLEESLRAIDGCTLFEGHAQFISPSEISINNLIILKAPHIFLNVGARPSLGNFDLKGVPYLTSSTILDLDQLPQKLVIVGGGLIGLEFAQMYRRFGADVTIIELHASLVSREDREASRVLQGILEAEGIEVCLNTECIGIHSVGDSVTIKIRSQNNESAVIGSHVLLAIGREPNTDDLAVGNAGIHLTKEGYVPIDGQLRSHVAGIWALGECNGLGARNDSSFNDFEIVVANVLHRAERSIETRIPVHILYTDPPLAQAGLTEEQVRRSGRPALIGFSHMTRVEKAVQKSEAQGFIKILVDKETNRILGATILGADADEAIHSAVTAMMPGEGVQRLQGSIHSYQTIAELIPAILRELKPLI
jgi:pyruvate/2-oxoglutarate dehydrogenase complex dihydrolipoamide dehydrogenase (E3) component